MSKLTKWLEGKQKPARTGWYEVKCTNNSSRFRTSSIVDGRVELMRYYECGYGWRFCPGGHPSNVGDISWCKDFWRGLAEEPIAI